MAKRKVGCVVCGAQLIADTVIVSEDDEGGPDIEQLDGFSCVDCGIKYAALPKAKVVTAKKWEWKTLDELGAT